jgi:hypothetical protein
VLDAVGAVLTPAVGVAVSPFPIVAAILVLGSARPRANGVAFAAGWLVGLTAITVLFIALTDGSGDADGDSATAFAWLRVLVGGLLLVLAARKWQARPRPGEVPEVPGWMAGLDAVEPPRAAVIGAALGGANPKNLAFTFAAAASIGSLGLEGGDAAVAGAVYVLLASASVLAAVGARLVAGARADAALAGVRSSMVANNAVILMVVFLVLGAKVLGDGLAAL